MAGPRWGVQCPQDMPTTPNKQTKGSPQTGGAPARQTSPGDRTPLPTSTNGTKTGPKNKLKRCGRQHQNTNTLTRAKTVLPIKATIRRHTRSSNTLTQAATVRPIKATVQKTHSLKQRQYYQLRRPSKRHTHSSTVLPIKATVEKTHSLKDSMTN